VSIPIPSGYLNKAPLLIPPPAAPAAGAISPALVSLGLRKRAEASVSPSALLPSLLPSLVPSASPASSTASDSSSSTSPATTSSHRRALRHPAPETNRLVREHDAATSRALPVPVPAAAAAAE